MYFDWYDQFEGDKSFNCKKVSNRVLEKIKDLKVGGRSKSFLNLSLNS